MAISNNHKTNLRGAIKCVVWDLDNTVWKGILLEDVNVCLFENIIEIIGALDSRGILQSIASKNEPAKVLDKLKQFGLEEYFLFPQINWNSKASSIEKIAESLNIGLDSIAFIDDDLVELNEVKFSHPEVTCLNATSRDQILSMPEMNPRFITRDSRLRRKMYVSEQARKQVEAEFVGPKEEFLASLDMKLSIGSAREEDLMRAEELTVRTNQLNTTGRTYSYDELNEYRLSDRYKLLIAGLDDRFGSYGKIGLALIECSEEVWTIKLLLMSCRIMTRGIGAVMINFIRSLAKSKNVRLIAEFIQTDRNRLMFVTYRLMGFREIQRSDDLLLLEDEMAEIPDCPPYIEMCFTDEGQAEDLL